MAFSISVIIAFSQGRKFPTIETKEKIAESSLLKHFSNWYAGYTWECVEVIQNGIGFMGMNAPNIIIENQDSKERIRLIGMSSIGKKFKLKPATKDQMNNGVWVSPSGRFVSLEPAK